MTDYFRPIAQYDALRPADALPLAGGWAWFSHAERISRSGSLGLVGLGDIPGDVLDRLTAPRAPIAGLTLSAPRLMGILNVTPDSFSDGGQFFAPQAALQQAQDLVAFGADILDIGGESTRPGAAGVDGAAELARTAPIIAALRQAGQSLPISIDTRKADVAAAAVTAGAGMINDVSALGFDPKLADIVVQSGLPVCLMHAQGTPADMQIAPRYDNVVLDVYDFLAERVAWAQSFGIARDKIVVDPGIGFGKTVAHNLALLRNLSIFHGLGCPVLLGASRKRFIATLAADGRDGAGRMPGSVAVALAGVAQGVQIVRVHDVAETRQSLTLWQALTDNKDMGAA